MITITTLVIRKALYPTLILNHGYISPQLGTGLLQVYGEIKEERLLAKKNKEKTKDTLMKLMLNGFSGLADSPTCWLYSPEQILAMRLHGQLLLSRVVEELGINSLSVISTNTDGAEVLIKPDQQDLLDSIIKSIEQEFNVVFEQEEYKSIYYKSVNDYLAITKDGKVKQKGEFISDKVLDGSNEFLVVPKALLAYWKDGTKPEDFIKQHTDVFDFCAAKKISRDYKVWYNGKEQQQLNRYLVATRAKGAYLYKEKDSKKKMENVLKDTPVILVNEACTKPASDYFIDYNFYIKKAREVINLFEPQQISSF